jgi:hypothetical protein
MPRRKRSTKLPTRHNPIVFIKVIFSILTASWTFLFSLVIQSHQLEVAFPSSGSPIIRLFVYAPHYLSQNEDEELRFAIENNQSNDTQVSLLLTNGNSGAAFLGLNESNLIYSGIIFPHQQINRQLKIFFPIDVKTLGNPVSLYLLTSINQGPPSKTELQLDISPIPYTRRLSTLLGAAWIGVFSWLFKEEWNKLRWQE